MELWASFLHIWHMESCPPPPHVTLCPRPSSELVQSEYVQKDDGEGRGGAERGKKNRIATPGQGSCLPGLKSRGEANSQGTQGKSHNVLITINLQLELQYLPHPFA